MPDADPGLFCSSWCKEAAKHVRWLPRAVTEGRLDDRETGRAAEIRLTMLSLGGYRAETRSVPPDVRAFVIERARGLCERCGAPGSEVDHVGGPSSDPSNLQYLCRTCHAAKTDLAQFGPEGFQVTTPDDAGDVGEDDDVAPPDPVRPHILRRVEAGEPALLCDDEAQWQGAWRALKAARKARLYERAVDAGLDAASLRGLTRAQILDEIADARADDRAAPDDYDGGSGPDSYFARAMDRDD